MAIRVSRAAAATVKFSVPQEIVVNHADDSIKIGDGTDLATVTTVGSDKGLDVVPLVALKAGLSATDAINADESGATANVYTYYSGGLAGSLLGTITVNYTDSTKTELDSVVRT